MMKIVVSSYSATPAADGRILLTLHGVGTDEAPVVTPSPAPRGVVDPLLYVEDVARLLRVTPRAVFNLRRRRRNPLPMQTGGARPCLFKSAFDAWLLGPSRRYHIAA